MRLVAARKNPVIKLTTYFSLGDKMKNYWREQIREAITHIFENLNKSDDLIDYLAKGGKFVLEVVEKTSEHDGEFIGSSVELNKQNIE